MDEHLMKIFLPFSLSIIPTFLNQRKFLRHKVGQKIYTLLGLVGFLSERELRCIVKCIEFGVMDSWFSLCQLLFLWGILISTYKLPHFFQAKEGPKAGKT